MNHRRAENNLDLKRKLNPYPSYKDSGIEWLGEIPAHWTVTRLKSFSTVQLSNVDKKSTEGQDAVQLCNYVDVYYNERIDGSIKFMSATATKEQVRRFSLNSGDVLITKDSETWTDIAVPAVVSEDLPGVLCGYHLAHIRPDRHCDGGFLSRLFAANGPRDQYHISANGITRFGLTGDCVRAGVFALPPLPEQRAIAAFLHRETARIDALVDKKERLIELLREKRAALISHAVTRGLDPNVQMKDSGVECLGEIPAHWEVVRLKYASRIQGGFAFSTGSFSNEGIPVVRMNNIRRGVLALDNVARIPKHMCNVEFALNAGDVIYGLSGSTGSTGSLGNFAVVRKCDVPAQLNQRVARFRPINARILREFLIGTLQIRPFYEQVLSYTTGTAQFNVSTNDIGNVILALPPLSEQRAIADFLYRETAKTDALVTKVREAIDHLKELRLALISAAVTGKIDVRNSLR